MYATAGRLLSALLHGAASARSISVCLGHLPEDDQCFVFSNCLAPPSPDLAAALHTGKGLQFEQLAALPPAMVFGSIRWESLDDLLLAFFGICKPLHLAELARAAGRMERCSTSTGHSALPAAQPSECGGDMQRGGTKTAHVGSFMPCGGCASRRTGPQPLWLAAFSGCFASDGGPSSRKERSDMCTVLRRVAAAAMWVAGWQQNTVDQEGQLRQGCKHLGWELLPIEGKSAVCTRRARGIDADIRCTRRRLPVACSYASCAMSSSNCGSFVQRSLCSSKVMESAFLQ
jgi:hypothetical protein